MRFRPALLVPALPALAALAALSCGGDAPTGPLPVASIVFPTSIDTVVVGDSLAVTPQLFASGNRLIPGRTATLTSSDTTIVRVAGMTAYGVTLGAATITARADAATAQVTVVVRPPRVRSVVLPFTNRTIIEGDTARIAPIPILIDQRGDTVTGRTISYTSANPGIVTVDQSTGLMRGVAPGSTSVTVSSDGASASVVVTVTPAPTASIRVVPGAVFLAPGGAWQLRGTALSAQGNALTGRTITYAGGDAAVATVGSTGLVQAAGTGRTTITVRNGDAATTVPVIVAGTGPGAFSIEVRTYGRTDPAVTRAAQAAADRWARAVVGQLLAYTVPASESAPGLCGKGVPAITGTIQNVVVYVTVDSIDGRGKTAAQAGPCLIRDYPPQLTVAGTLELDKADVASADQAGVLTDLIMHEMGHVLGIGTLWDLDSFSGTVTGLGTSDPLFLGQRARVASAQLGFTSDSTLGVPIENTGGDGTRDGHWRDAVFFRELMTGTLHLSGNPLSLVSIQALADMGYQVAPTAAAAFSANDVGTGGVSAQRNAPTDGLFQFTDRPLKPRFTVSRTGRVRPIGRR